MPEPDLIWHQYARPGLLASWESLRTPVVTVREFFPNGLPHRRVRKRVVAGRDPAAEASPEKERPWPADTR
ncbi:hypothetical protein BBK82_04335 [Lentzea guizhouensis]|uniref:Uncharacterized protein n=2 Tax=Lentzea guizhouensis TaxID=1586287 RepID=A0A1B2HCH8_9PSEU|nr:hypothetical protein BBK82_04335 [Lentzea guizhouensis]